MTRSKAPIKNASEAAALANMIPEIMSLTHRLTRGVNCPENITIPQFKLLQNLYSAGKPLSMSDLSQLIGVAQSTLTETVKKLVASGHIIRERSAEDDRVVELSLTKMSAKLIEEHQQSFIQFYERVCSQLTEQQAKNLKQSHEVILNTYRMLLARELEEGP